jgi:hypothetical protein
MLSSMTIVMTFLLFIGFMFLMYSYWNVSFNTMTILSVVFVSVIVYLSFSNKNPFTLNKPGYRDDLDMEISV